MKRLISNLVVTATRILFRLARQELLEWLFLDEGEQHLQLLSFICSTICSG